MRLIVGLGNPGQRYVFSRHNIGWVVVEKLASLQAGTAHGQWRRQKGIEVFDFAPGVILAKPQLLMNRSGPPVAALMRRRGISPADLWVVHDDLDLGLGEIRLVRKRGGGGHRGVISLIETLGKNDFYRFRIGIGRPSFGLPREGGKQMPKLFSKEKIEEYVLASFLPREADECRRAVKQAVKLILAALEDGIEIVRLRGGR